MCVHAANMQPLPERHVALTLDRFDGGFVRARCYLLHLFMQALLRLSTCIVRNSDFSAFITLDERVCGRVTRICNTTYKFMQKWLTYRRNSCADKSTSVTEMISNLTLGTTRSTHAKYTEYVSRCEQLAVTLTAIDKMTSRAHTAEQTHTNELFSVHVGCAQLCARTTCRRCSNTGATVPRIRGRHRMVRRMDTRRQQPVSGTKVFCAYEIHKHVCAIVASIVHVTHAMYETAAAAQHCVERHEKDITLPLQHLALYCRAVCSVLQRREQLSNDVNKLNDTLARKLCDLQKVPYTR